MFNLFRLHCFQQCYNQTMLLLCFWKWTGKSIRRKWCYKNIILCMMDKPTHSVTLSNICRRHREYTLTVCIVFYHYFKSAKLTWILFLHSLTLLWIRTIEKCKGKIITHLYADRCLSCSIRPRSGQTTAFTAKPLAQRFHKL